MSVDIMRPDDLELLRHVGRNLRRAAGAAVVFGGLRSADRIRVTMAAGGHTGRLSTITLEPDKGLGGRSWLSRRPLTVHDYATCDDITHDFDRQILGEGIVSLSVVPIVVRRDVRGLLYAGTRGRVQGTRELVAGLRHAAERMSSELHLRDQVDARVRLVRTAQDPAVGAAGETLRELHAELRRVASETTDSATAQDLRHLLGTTESKSGEALTPRQVDVLSQVALGLRNAEVAERLGLSVTTVKSYLRDVMSRLGARTRYEAVLEARRRGLLP